MSQITLYDLPSKGRCACWSYNPWKTRLALNYKNLNYQTKWVEYPDIESTLKPHVPPNDPNTGRPYTIPAVQFGIDDYLMDSAPIVARLERDYPTPSLHLDSPALKDAELVRVQVLDALRGVWMPLVPKNLLNEASLGYFERTRKQAIGKSLEEYQKEVDADQKWTEALPGIKRFGEVLKKEGGPFVLGESPSYADFVVVAILQFLKRIDESLYKHVVDVEPAYAKLYDASKPWLERDNY